uniref:Uncharacterized protein n=1 Tax=viral metagenome TaxID=1070528 RepID=A0A6H2A2W7_9ZZZZ
MKFKIEKNPKVELLQKPTAKNYAEHLTLKSEINSKIEEIKAALPEVCKPFAKRVGAWIWIEKPLGFDFSAKDQGKLRKLGFHFNPKRNAWQNPCGIETKKSYHDPRKKYGVLDLFKGVKTSYTELVKEKKPELGESSAPF